MLSAALVESGTVPRDSAWATGRWLSGARRLGPPAATGYHAPEQGHQQQNFYEGTYAVKREVKKRGAPNNYFKKMF